LRKHSATIWTELFKIDEPVGCEDVVDIKPEEDPHFFMFALPRMVYNFKRYGDCTYFNIIKGLVKKKNVFDTREWEIIAFNGLTFHNRFAPFALAFLEVTPHTSEERIELIKRVFRWGSKSPKTFITPHQPVYAEIVATLRAKGIFGGLHLYDALEELEHIEKVVSDKNNFKYFQEIVYSTSKAEYLNNLQRFYQNVVPTLENRKMLNSLQAKASSMCFALIETDRFIGMGFRYSATRYMSTLIRYLYTRNSQAAKINLPKPRELYPSIKIIAKEYIKILQPELPYIRYELWKLESFMMMPEIELLRHRLK
jgi:hypothetical protein